MSTQPELRTDNLYAQPRAIDDWPRYVKQHDCFHIAEIACEDDERTCCTFRETVANDEEVECPRCMSAWQPPLPDLAGPRIEITLPDRHSPFDAAEMLDGLDLALVCDADGIWYLVGYRPLDWQLAAAYVRLRQLPPIHLRLDPALALVVLDDEDEARRVAAAYDRACAMAACEIESARQAIASMLPRPTLRPLGAGDSTNL